MCLELLYENSESKYQVDFSYLAINDKIIVNKMLIVDDSEDDYGFYNNKIFIRLESAEDIMTMLINYDDEENELLESLLYLQNNDLFDELYSNVLDIITDTMINYGFIESSIGNEIFSIIEKPLDVIVRLVDFQMNVPEENDIHPLFDT